MERCRVPLSPLCNESFDRLGKTPIPLVFIVRPEDRDQPDRDVLKPNHVVAIVHDPMTAGTNLRVGVPRPNVRGTKTRQPSGTQVPFGRLASPPARMTKPRQLRSREQDCD